MASDCICQSVNRSCRLLRTSIGVHTHLTEIIVKARLHKGSSTSIERLTRRAQYLMDYARHIRNIKAIPLPALQALLFLPALLALSSTGVLATRALPLKDGTVRRSIFRLWLN